MLSTVRMFKIRKFSGQARLAQLTYQICFDKCHSAIRMNYQTTRAITHCATPLIRIRMMKILVFLQILANVL